MFQRTQLRPFFQSPFHGESWQELLATLFASPELEATPVRVNEGEREEEGYYLGCAELEGNIEGESGEGARRTGFRIGFFRYIIRSGSVAHKKVGLARLVRSFVHPSYGMFDAVLVVFDGGSHWRLSFVSDINDREKKTNPKRFTFVFGDAQNQYNTPVERFGGLLQKARAGLSYEDLMGAFSVEALTKQFYQDLFGWFERAVAPQSGITFPAQTTESRDEKIIRMITRIMFVWFIRQKGLVPDSLFDREALKGILRDFDPESTTQGCYYNAILQNLFFATLNRALEDESGAKRGFASSKAGHDVKTLYRYAEMFSISEEEVINLFAQVPFLNGGLFECLDKDRTMDGVDAFYHDGFTRNDAKTAKGVYRNRAFVPNACFFHPEDGLFAILSRYNFTIEENSPREQQVALDPELLGRVFENLLGAYNPETQKTARKQSGSYYTPREIVDYMVDESLKAYLGGGERVEALFRDSGEPSPAGDSEDAAIAAKLKRIKVLDPACGSGAFPMGLMLRMVDILHKLQPGESLYRLKLSIIENCLYGSDIQSIAAQITKLRFFISLICDCEKDDSLPNFGMPTLPNLETKFVAANSLVRLKRERQDALSLSDAQLAALRAQLQQLRHEHFNARTASAKKRIRERDAAIRELICNRLMELNPVLDTSHIDEKQHLIHELKEELNRIREPHWVDASAPERPMELLGLESPEVKTSLFRVDAHEKRRKEIKKLIKEYQAAIKAEQAKVLPQTDADEILRELTSWNPYDQNAVSPFFEPEWMFGVENGFDIVIGNPPYISTRGISEADKKKYEQVFGFSDDTYNLFTFRGMELCAEGGVLSYITPTTFWTTQTKLNMRRLLLSNTIDYIYHTNNPFESVMVDTCITQVQKKAPADGHQLRFLLTRVAGRERVDFCAPVVLPAICQSVYLNALNSVIFKPTENNLRIHAMYGEKVKALYHQWWDKIKTSREIERNKEELAAYRASLRPGDLALLGCLTEGGQGLATGNNGKYIAVRRATKWADKIMEERPKRLADAMKEHNIALPEMPPSANTADYLRTLSESEIAALFDRLKEQYGRDIFKKGGYIYKIVEEDDIADVESLTEEEKSDGIDASRKHYVPYDKGDKDGNRWYLETPFAIAWTRENVRALKADRAARFQGSAFYFKEGFCWIDVNSTYLRARVKGKGVFDILSMSLFSVTDLPDWYFVSLINSEFISLYVDNFLNNTSHFQLNDARQLPVMIPSAEELEEVKEIYTQAHVLKRQEFGAPPAEAAPGLTLEDLQQRLDALVARMYAPEAAQG